MASDIWTLYTVTLEESWQRRVNLKPALPGTMSSLLMDFIKRELNKSAKHAETRKDCKSVRYLRTCFRIYYSSYPILQKKLVLYDPACSFMKVTLIQCQSISRQEALLILNNRTERLSHVQHLLITHPWFPHRAQITAGCYKKQ